MIWAATNIVCDRCGHKQVSVHPLCERVECSVCGYMNQVPPSTLSDSQLLHDTLEPVDDEEKNQAGR